MASLQSRLSHTKYRPDIDGLRAIAVLSVVTFHAFPNWVKGGFVGVDIFFVISGFLISTIIFENLEKESFSLTEFYARRIKRIFPALLLVLISSYIFGWFALLDGEYKQLGKHIAAGAGFLSNFVLWNEAGYFDNSAEMKPLLHLWSLGIEEQFYIIWPLLLWFAWCRNYNLFVIIFVSAAISFYLNIEGIQKDVVATFYSPQTRFWELLCGSLLAWIAVYKNDALAKVKIKIDGLLVAFSKQSFEADGQMLSNILSLLGFAALAFSIFYINKDFSFPGKWALAPVLGAVLIISAGPHAWFNRSILSNHVAVWFGLISYPLYLWHWPLLSFTRIIEGEVPSGSARIAVVVFSIVLAWITYKFVEQPIRLGKFSKTKIPSLLVLMSVVGFIGFNTYSRDGLDFRHKSNLVMDEQAINDERAKYWAGGLQENFDSAPIKVIVYGDSQGFDIYKSLKMDDRIGIKIFQKSHECTSFNLPKNGLEAKAKVCQDAFARLIASPEILKADVLIYSFYWNKDSEPLNALENYRDALSQIKALNPTLKVVFFGPKPLLGKTWISINSITNNHKSIIGMNDYLNRIRWIRDDTDYVKLMSEALCVFHIDVNEVFCLDGCQFYVDMQFAYFDQNHWTEFGAKLFLDKLIRLQKFKEIFLE